MCWTCGGCPPGQLRAERDRLAQLRAAVSAGPLAGAAAGHPAGRRGRAGPPAGPRRPPGRRRAGRGAGRAAGGAGGSLPAARERLVLAEHALRTTTGQADQAAERLGHAAARPAAAPGLDGSPRRRAARPGAGGGAGGCLAAPGRPARPGPGPAGLAAGRTRPRPHRPRRSGRCGAWPPRNWTAIGAPTAWTTTGRRSMLGAGWPGTGGRLRRPPRPPASGPTGPRGQPERRGRGERRHRRGDRGQPADRWRPTGGTGSTRAGCWAPSPAGEPPGRRRDWQAARAALERLAGPPPPPPRPPPAARRARRPAALAATSAARNATAARRWQKGAAHAPAPRPRPRRPRRRARTWRSWARPVYQGNGLSVRALTAEELQRFLDAHAGQPAELLGSGWAALDPPGTPSGFPGPLRPPTAAQRCRPSRSPAAWAAPAAPPWPQYRRRRAAELAAWTRSLAWRAPLVAAAGLAGQVLAAQAGLPQGRAGRPGGRRAGRLAAAVPPLRAGPHLAARRRTGSGAPPACWTGSPATATWSSTTWPCPARPPTWITW